MVGLSQDIIESVSRSEYRSITWSTPNKTFRKSGTHPMFAMSPTTINDDMPIFIQIRSPASCNYQAIRRLTVSHRVPNILTGTTTSKVLKGARGRGRREHVNSP